MGGEAFPVRHFRQNRPDWISNSVPRLKCSFREFIKIIEAHGFTLDRQDGSHRQYVGIVGAKRRVVTAAVINPGDEIRTGTLKAMIRQSGLPDKLFRK
jgi:predicted RNA binding protein YcfA (HicA-like mRNA interferase family)